MRTTENDIFLLKQLLFCELTDIQNFITHTINNMYSSKLDKSLLEKSFYAPGKYVYIEGDMDILLIAHLDTVFPHGIYPYFDPEANVMFSGQGLGADDRAGVFAILKILEAGFRPSILFTYGEEQGCIGLDDFLDHHPMPFKDFKFMIQLDRQGFDDSVYYDCDNKDFERYINSFGFKTAEGSFTDVMLLSSAWKISGVNLSIGYINEHTAAELFFIDDCMETIEKVIDILSDKENHVFYPFVQRIYSAKHHSFDF